MNPVRLVAAKSLEKTLKAVTAVTAAKVVIMASQDEIQVGESYTAEIINYGSQGDPIAAYGENNPVIILGKSETDSRPVVGDKVRVAVTARPEDDYFLGVLKETNVNEAEEHLNGSEASNPYNLEKLPDTPEEMSKSALIDAFRDAGILESDDVTADNGPSSAKYRHLRLSGIRKLAESLKELE